MEHVTITPMGDKLSHLVPDEGYVLHNKRTNSDYSDAVVSNRDIIQWSAVEK